MMHCPPSPIPFPIGHQNLTNRTDHHRVAVILRPYYVSEIILCDPGCAGPIWLEISMTLQPMIFLQSLRQYV